MKYSKGSVSISWGGNSDKNANSQAENTPSVTITATDTPKVDVEDNEENNETGNEENNEKVPEEDIEAAKKVAMDYYTGTVFEVNSMTCIEHGTNYAAEGECNFMVNVSKDGQVQEPNRMISLNRTTDSWEVASEGF